MTASGDDVSAISARATAGDRRTAVSAAAPSAALSRPPTQRWGMPPAATTAARAASRSPAGVTKTALATGGPDVRAPAALARVPSVIRAANAHESANLVRIGASLADAEVAIAGTVAKRTKLRPPDRRPGL